jgi:hypothetical protein
MTTKCWTIQWISAERKIYEQIDTAAVYSTAKAVLTSINEIIEDKKRDIEVDGVSPPKEFGVFTEEVLNKMNPDNWLTIWKYDDYEQFVIVCARQMY